MVCHDLTTRDHLRARLTLLRDGGYNVMPLADALERLNAGTLPERSIALTFDDAFEDFGTEVVPLLREFGMPATLFPTTYYSVARLPVFDSLMDYVLWSARQHRVSQILVGTTRVLLATESRSARRRTWRDLKAAADRALLDTRQRDALVSGVAGALGVDDAAIRARGVARIMSPEAIRAVSGDLVSVQLHTHRHRLPQIRSEFLRELDDNALALRDMQDSSIPLSVMCYPSGHWHDAAFTWMRERGVKWAVTCDPALAEQQTPNFLIPRLVDTMAQSPARFEAWASGLAAWWPRRAGDRRRVGQRESGGLRNPWNSMREIPSVRSTT
jgi:Polysaccharide deacetylase